MWSFLCLLFITGIIYILIPTMMLLFKKNKRKKGVKKNIFCVHYLGYPVNYQKNASENEF